VLRRPRPAAVLAGLFPVALVAAACRPAPNGPSPSGASGSTDSVPSGSASSVVAASFAPLGASAEQVERRCTESGGAWERGAGDCAMCRGMRRDGPTGVDVRTWLSAGVAAAETSYGPLESFEGAKARAERIARAAWGEPEGDTWLFDCGGADPRQKVESARSRKCRWSWRWRKGDRRTHLLVAPRADGHWQVVLDESQAPPPGPALAGAYPASVGRFQFGETTAGDESACRASGGHFVAPNVDSSPSCQAVDVAVGIPRATVWLHHECEGDRLCRLIVEGEASGEREAVDRYLLSRRVLVERLGPTDEIGGSGCGVQAAERLVDALRDGHCRLSAHWEKDGAGIALDVEPPDEALGGAFSYPILRWAVGVGFTSPMHVEREKRLPPADLVPVTRAPLPPTPAVP
jgi:hypothetical protein